MTVLTQSRSALCHHLAAAIVRKHHTFGCCGASVAASSRAGAECLDTPPWASHPCVPRAENVEAILAEQGSSAIWMLFHCGVFVRCVALVQAPGSLAIVR